jgi:hypothetical protein
MGIMGATRRLLPAADPGKTLGSEGVVRGCGERRQHESDQAAPCIMGATGQMVPSTNPRMQSRC